jgi:hypothetical protein
LLLIYRCPFCDAQFAATELQQPAGLGGGSFCPKCQERVSVSFAFARPIAIGALFVAFGILFVLKIRTILWLTLGTIILWVPISLALKLYAARFKAPILVKWEERRHKQRHKTFFEWLYERDRIRAPKIDNKNE